MQGLGCVASGVYSGGRSLHPAVRVSDFQRRPSWTCHQEWSEGTRHRAQGGHVRSSHLRPAGLWRLPWRRSSPAVGQGRGGGSGSRICA